MGRTARVHDHRSGDDRDPSARRLDVAHHRGDALDADFDPALRRNLVRHEREAVAIAIAELRRHAHAGHAAHDPIAGPHVAQLAAARGPCRRSTITASMRCFCDVEPAAAAAHHRAVVRRRVEIVRHAAVAVGDSQERVGLIRQAAAERHQLLEHLAQDLLARRRDSHRNRRRLVVAAADVELEHVERRVALDHGVEHDVQHLRIDQVAFGLDDLAESRRVCHRGTRSGRRSASPAAAGRDSRTARRRRARGRAPTRDTPRAWSRTAGGPSGSAAAAARLRC